MFGLLRRGAAFGTAGLIASCAITAIPTPIAESTLQAPSKYVSMVSRMRNNGFKLNDEDREELDKTLLYLFQSKIFESPYHSLYLCYPQTSSAFLENWGFGGYGSVVFDNQIFYFTIAGFMISIMNMTALFIAN